MFYQYASQSNSTMHIFYESCIIFFTVPYIYFENNLLFHIHCIHVMHTVMCTTSLIADDSTVYTVASDYFITVPPVHRKFQLFRGFCGGIIHTLSYFEQISIYDTACFCILYLYIDLMPRFWQLPFVSLPGFPIHIFLPSLINPSSPIHIFPSCALLHSVQLFISVSYNGVSGHSQRGSGQSLHNQVLMKYFCYFQSCIIDVFFWLSDKPENISAIIYLNCDYVNWAHFPCDCPLVSHCIVLYIIFINLFSFALFLVCITAYII